MSGFAYSNLFARNLPAPAARTHSRLSEYNFIGGHNDPTLIPIEGLIAATTAALKKEGSKLAMYTAAQGSQGHLGLREFVRTKAKIRGIDCSTDDILMPAGSGQGIDLINAVLLEPGDTVIVEEFSYGGAINKLKREGQKIVAAPLDEDGIRIDALANILKDLKGKGIAPKYIYHTIPTIQNPTGSIMPLDRRQQLLKVAIEYGVPIFEDECYADLIWGGTVAPPAIYSMDRDHVIHIGSFSKTLAPALRLGYCIADWKFMSQMIACRSDSGSGVLEQMVVAEYFSQHFGDHVDELSETLKGKLDTMVEALEREFGTAVEAVDSKGRHLSVDEAARPGRHYETGAAGGQGRHRAQSRTGMGLRGRRFEIAAAAVLCADEQRGDPRRGRRAGAGLPRADRHPRTQRECDALGRRPDLRQTPSRGVGI